MYLSKINENNLSGMKNYETIFFFIKNWKIYSVLYNYVLIWHVFIYLVINLVSLEGKSFYSL